MKMFLPLPFLSVVLAAQVAPNLNNLDYNAIDNTCKPCDDFYQFSIGKWNAANPIPANQTRWGKRWAGADGNLDVLKSILEDPSLRGAGAGSDPRLIGDFYGACMDTASVDARGAKPLEPALKRIREIEDRRGLEREIATLHGQGLSAGFSLSAGPDTDNPSQMISSISAAGLGMPDRDYYLAGCGKTKQAA